MVALALDASIGAAATGGRDRYADALPAIRSNAQRCTANAAVPPRFDDLDEERAPPYRRWLAASIGVHMVIASLALFAVVPGISPQGRIDPTGMIVTLVDGTPVAPKPTSTALAAIRDPGLPIVSVPPARVKNDEAKVTAGTRLLVSGASTSVPVPSSRLSAQAIDDRTSAPAVATIGPSSSAIPTVVASRSPAELAWERAIVVKLGKRKHYPSTALRAGLSDSVLLRLVVGRDGRLLAAELAKSRGIAAFDQSVLAMAEKASPFPAPPPSMTGDAFRLVVPIEFAIGRP